MKFFILTDLEGVAGCDSFSQTRTTDIVAKGPAMRQLAKEVNACVEGIKSVYPDAEVDVWDGHGTGGLFPDDLVGCRYIDMREKQRKPYHHLQGYAAMLFVGQHAMAGTVDAPLNHTYSSKEIMYYRLNDIFIGEFGARALLAGIQSVPTVFLSGDDKAALEARMFIPQIETVVTKYGKGVEAADHLDPASACRFIAEGAGRAVRRMHEIPPYRGIRAPYRFEARHYGHLNREAAHFIQDKVEFVDDRTYRIEIDDLFSLPF